MSQKRDQKWISHETGSYIADAEIPPPVKLQDTSEVSLDLSANIVLCSPYFIFLPLIPGKV